MVFPKIASPLWSISTLTLLTFNVDDQTPELLSHLCTSLLSTSGILDAWQTPIFMKKGRAGVTVSALCEPGGAAKATEVAFRNSTTLGVRAQAVDRASLRRTFLKAKTPFSKSEVRIKVGWMGEDAVSVKPEFEDCRRVAEEGGVPCKVVQDWVRCEVIKTGEGKGK